MNDLRERFATVDPFSVHVVEWGDGAQPTLLVHGLGGNTVSWEPVGPLLAGRLGATVTAPDLPGFGLTRVPPRQRGDFAAHSHVLDGLLDELGPAIVIGNSMGGSLSVALAARKPDLVRALVLVDPAQPLGPGQHPHVAAMMRMAPTMFPPLGRFVLSTRARILGATRLVDSTLATTLVDPTSVDPALRQRLIEMTEQRAAFPEATGAFVDSTRSLFSYLTRRMAADLARVTAPTLLVHGVNDRLVAVGASRALAARRSDITLEVIEDCGHTPQLECPERLADLVATWVPGVLSAL